MALASYRKKRNFNETPEPAPSVKSSKKGSLAFVVQRHKASRLHYDFRLELDGVLKSWAVPKGPSMDPGDKRLAMMVEDHPYDYKDFKGVIPSGYGAGIVEIWDKGTYTALADDKGTADEKLLQAGLKKGDLKFNLKGKKLKGEFALVKLKGNSEENAWLLIKHRDKYAVDGYNSEDHTPANSPINKSLARENKSSSLKKTPAKKTKSSKAGKAGDETGLTFGRITVPVTNRQKIYFPETGVTKGDVIDYYQAASEYLLPYLKNRPQSLFRTPNGINAKGFFQKDAGDNVPEWVKTFGDYAESSSRLIDYILCNNNATLAYLNNLGCIEINPWHSVISKPGSPDYLIIDLDPSLKNTFDDVVECALCVKDIFDMAGVPSYVKTSGGTGLHVYVPMGRKYDYDKVKNFAHIVCMMVEEQLPSLTTLERSLKKRNRKKIYLDYLQNNRSQTIASVYSLRPKPGAPVSMPLNWKEVKKGLSPLDFNIHNALKRIKSSGDSFKGILGKGISLPSALKNLGAAGDE